ncbi:MULTISPECIES: hypothetical protein [unclassified Solwaraspora]|uniref:hypothetical protein n=1 Tax=unclassified Solwaraspora TaxID=2627926 RepID=UPI00259B405C|nr:hypothetical protein [Solwaraspora sp. WMMA2056]WJK41406.1 hypothetical protein O7608_02930 [Solwaraspora sp. WMMA2056]
MRILMSGNDQTVLDEISSRVELGNIFFTRLSADLKQLRHVERMGIEVEVSYAIRSNKLLYRFKVKCELYGNSSSAARGEVAHPEADSVELARIELDLVSEYMPEKDFQLPGSEVLEEFGDKIAVYVAYPYIREAVSSMTLRLGFPALTLGLLQDGQRVPSSATGRRP